ncbi:MAG TPA: T9SS type A sorting domain-containing protein [Bacteroidia bacterium]|jgi:hypothetical protein|nr:T9SS type A sorting domain-containing protein [Bacteroidia bacterium]
MKREFIYLTLGILLSFVLPNKVSATVINDGYTDMRSYDPGDTVKIYINALGIFNNTKIYLLDIENARKDSIITSVIPQNIAGLTPWEDGFGYGVTATYIIPSFLHSGIYSWDNKIFFIIKSATKNAAITILYPTNTEEAYNYAGTKSLYDYNSTNGRAHIVSFQRGFNSWMINTVKAFTTPFIQWLYTLPNYDVQMIADMDMDDYSEFSHSQILLVAGHSEYWTKQARINFDQFVDSGKQAIVLSGNTMWWQVRYSDDKTQLICYKDSALDPEDDPLEKTINWPDASLQYSVLKSIGVDWIHGAYANKPYHGYYGFKITAPSSPLLQGTNLTLHDTLTCQANEDDATLFYGFDQNGEPLVDTTSLGFCKLEMIGYDWGESIYYPNNPQRGYGTFIAFRRSPLSGNIINVANSNWCGNVNAGSSQGGFSSRDSLQIKQITLNMLDLLLANADIYSNTGGNCVPTSVEPVAETNLNVFPNPASQMVTIQFGNSAGENYVVQLVNSLGQIVYTGSSDGQFQTTIDVSSFAEGTYFYSIVENDAVAGHGKIVVQR